MVLPAPCIREVHAKRGSSPAANFLLARDLNVSHSKTYLLFTVILDLVFQIGERLLASVALQAVIEFSQGDGNDVVVMQLTELPVTGDAQPNVMHQLEVLGPEAR